VSLDVATQAFLSAGPTTGAGGVIGFLEIKRSSAANWTFAFQSYIFTTIGPSVLTNLFGNGSAISLQDLALLGEGSGIPSAIDVRYTAFGLYAGGFVPVDSSICQGKMTITF
jgi:hypothetical protein